MRPLLLALGIALVPGTMASAQDFVPFDPATPSTDAERPPAERAPEAPSATAPDASSEAADKAEASDAEPTPETPTTEEGGAAWPALSGETPPQESEPGEGLGEGRRLVEEKLVDERVEPIGASALAPATRDNAAVALENERPAPSFMGAIGLARLRTARVGTAGSVRLSLTGEFFALNDFLIVGDHETRQSSTFAVGWTPTEWLEAYANMAYTSSTNTLSSPNLLQIQGDSSLGAKAVYRAGDSVALALDLELSFFPPIGKVGFGAAGFSPRALFAYDIRPALPKLPAIFHLEVGFNFDGTGSLPGDLNLSRVEEFALGIQRYNRFLAGAALEFPLPWVSPFIAWRLKAPLGQVELPSVVDNGVLRTLGYGEVVSQHLALGLRVTAIRDLSFLLTTEIGLSGAAIPGVPATMPWNLMLGVSYTLDPLSKAERVTRTMQRTIEVEIETRPPGGAVEGTVTDATTGEPLGGALLVVSESDALPVASAPGSGRYRSRELAPGQVELTASREGYAPQTQAALVADKAVTPLSFSLQKLLVTGTLTLAISDSKSKAGLPAKVSIEGPEPLQLSADATGRAEAELKPGAYRLTVTAEGHNARQKDLEIENGGKLLVDLELSPKARRRLVIVRKNKIQLKRKVHFQLGKAEILPDSYQLLDQVIDSVVANKIEKLRIEGHTDSTGADGRNLRLSQARAESVRTYFVERGIAEDRIEARGFGETKPIAPNLTKRGRAMNRRVEFHIVAR